MAAPPQPPLAGKGVGAGMLQLRYTCPRCDTQRSLLTVRTGLGSAGPAPSTLGSAPRSGSPQTPAAADHAATKDQGSAHPIWATFELET